MAQIGRRTVLRTGLKVGVGLGLAPAVAIGQGDPTAIGPTEGDLLVKAADPARTPLTAGDIQPDAKPVFAWAMDPTSGTVRNGSRLHQLLLVRLDPDRLRSETRTRAADGVVAYTAICTHQGCEVDDWLPAEQVLYCACHGSKYDPEDSARVLEGEAPRPLPALPLKLNEGRLMVAGPFNARVGFQSA